MIARQFGITSFQPDSWRKTPAIKSKRNDVGAVVTYQQQLDNQWTTSLNALDATSYVIAMGASANNVNFIENVAKSQLDPSYVEPSIKTPSPLHTRSVLTIPTASHNATVWGNKLISCGNNHLVQIYKLNHMLFNSGQGFDLMNEVQLDTLALHEIPLSAPEKMIRTTRITKACFEPVGAQKSGTNETPVKRFAAIQGQSLLLYDIETSQILGEELFVSDTLNAFAFSPHPPSGQLCAVGGARSNLTIMDTKMMQQEGAMAKIWSIKDAHVGEITDIAFNSFIPYWLATSGEDGVVKMWDIRYLRGTAARIDAHYSSISSIAWSNTHCEVISTTSYDRSWRAWNIGYTASTAKVPWKEYMVGCTGSDFETPAESRMPDKCIIGSTMIGDYNQFTAPLVAVVSDPVHADCFLSLTALGTLSSHMIRSKVFQELYENRYENPYEQELEDSIQSRNLNEAYETMVRLSRVEFSRDPSIASHESALIKLCTIRPPINPGSWRIGSKSVCETGMVREDLKDFTYGLPPRFDHFPQWTDKAITDQIQIQFNLVLLRHSLTHNIANGNWEFLIQKEQEILQGVALDDEFIDIDVTTLIFETLLVNKYMKGITFGLALGQLLADVPRFKFETLADALLLLVFPTVYDSFEWLPGNDVDWMKMTAAVRQGYIKKFIDYRKTVRAAAAKEQPLTESRRRKSLQPKISRIDPDLDPKSARKLIRAQMGDGKRALPMVSLEIRLLRMIENPIEEYNDEIIRIMQNVLTDSGLGGSRTKAGIVPFERTISVTTNRLYLNALKEKKIYEEYFGVSIQLITASAIIINNLQAYFSLEFSKGLVRQLEEEGCVSAKAHLGAMINSASNTISSIMASQSQQPQPVISSVKLLKDSFVMIVKITAHLMDGMEFLKAEKEELEILCRITTILTALMMQASATMLKAFEHFDKIAKPQCREFAHSVHDAVREAARMLPLTSTKSRPTTTSDKAASGLTVQEEANKVLEKLYTEYLKSDSK